MYKYRPTYVPRNNTCQIPGKKNPTWKRLSGSVGSTFFFFFFSFLPASYALDCPSGQTLYSTLDKSKLGADCPAPTSKDYCVSTSGDMLINVDGWRPLLDNEALAPQKYNLLYIVDRAAAETPEQEALLVIVTKDYKNDSVVFRNVLLTRNRNNEFEKKDTKINYQSFHDKPQNEGTDSIIAWHELPNSSFDTLEPEARRASFLLSPSDSVLNDRLPHARIYQFTSNKMSCIPFFFEWQPDVDVIDIIVRELIRNDPDKFVSRSLRKK